MTETPKKKRINSRSKGQRGEREVAFLLNSVVTRVSMELGVDLRPFTRNLVQTRNGGHDLVGQDWIAIEVKWYNEIKSHLPRWWEQTLRQAEAVNAEPVLIYKANGSRWFVRMWARLEIEPGRRLRVTADISMDDFIAWFERRLKVETKKMIEAGHFPGAIGLFD